MLTYYLTDIDDEGFANLCQFINDNHDTICEGGMVVYLESDGGCAKYLTPIANLLNNFCARVEVIRAFSTAFYITMLLECPIVIGIDSETMVHKAFTMLQFPAPKGDKGYAEQKRSLLSVQKYLDDIAELALSKEQFKAYTKGKELYFTTDEFNAILARARKAREEGKFERFVLGYGDVRPEPECEFGDDGDAEAHNSREFRQKVKAVLKSEHGECDGKC